MPAVVRSTSASGLVGSFFVAAAAGLPAVVVPVSVVVVPVAATVVVVPAVVFPVVAAVVVPIAIIVPVVLEVAD